MLNALANTFTSNCALKVASMKITCLSFGVFVLTPAMLLSALINGSKLDVALNCTAPSFRSVPSPIDFGFICPCAIAFMSRYLNIKNSSYSAAVYTLSTILAIKDWTPSIERNACFKSSS